MNHLSEYMKRVEKATLRVINEGSYENGKEIFVSTQLLPRHFA